MCLHKLIATNRPDQTQSKWFPSLFFLWCLTIISPTGHIAELYSREGNVISDSKRGIVCIFLKKPLSLTIFLANHCSKHTPKAPKEYLISHLFSMNYIKLKHMIVKLKKNREQFAWKFYQLRVFSCDFLYNVLKQEMQKGKQKEQLSRG